jgi:hypothetical protein
VIGFPAALGQPQNQPRLARERCKQFPQPKFKIFIMFLSGLAGSISPEYLPSLNNYLQQATFPM